MRWTKIYVIAFGIFGIVSWGFSQNVIDDRGTGTVNHNYFAAAQSDELRKLLLTVRNYHLRPCPHSPEGVYKDIAIGRYDYAQGDLQYILERFVNDPTALQLITPVVLATKQYSWGIERFEHALAWYPNYAITHAQYGTYLVEIGNVKAGTERLEKAIDMDPKLLAGYVWLNKAYLKQGKTEDARRAAAKAKELGYKGSQ